MTGRVRRETGRERDKADREESLWAGKYAKAETEADLLAVEFDRLRATLAELSTRRRTRETKRLTGELARRREELSTTVGDVHE